MTGHINLAGTWKDVPEIYAKVAGDWKTVTEGHTKIAGAWKQFYAPAAAGSYDLLATTILTSSASSVTFSSLGDYATDYQHLQIRAAARYGVAGSFYDNMRLQFNADTGSNYAWHRLRGNGSTVTSAASSSQSNILVGYYATSGSTAPNVIDILDPFETSKNTTLRSLAGAAETTDKIISLNSGLWMNTNALTEIKLFTSSGEFQSNSRFSLYGLRK
jgi:hypothetical protein